MRTQTPATYAALREAEIDTLWEYECQDAYHQGILKSIKEDAYVADQSTKTKPAYFVTVNPMDTVPIEQLKSTAEKWVKQKYIDTVDYTFEQTGTTPEDMGQHPHLHAIVTTNTNFKDLLKRVHSTFKKLVGSEASIDIKQPTGSHLDNCKKYLVGDKSSVEKCKRVLMDKRWREKYCLSNIYNHSNGNDTSVSAEEVCSETCVQEEDTTAEDSEIC